MGRSFEWDVHKARTNLTKHGVGFDEAASVFSDPLAKIFEDEAHSLSEAREIIIGHSRSGHLMLVCFTERSEQVRIFSARLATQRERRDYEQSISF